MKYEYEYEFFDGHIVVCAGGERLLIDTGAPSSTGSSSPLGFAGGEFSVEECYLEVSPESLSKSIGTQIDALVGTDILNRYDILIDPAAHRFVLTEGELPLAGGLLELDSFMGIPILEAATGGETVRMFFDTGAKLSYLDSELTDRLEPVGTATDFYPGVGEFSTNAYDVVIDLASEKVVLRVGNLPELLRTALMVSATKGVLGTAILKTHKVVYAPRRQRMALLRIGE